MKHTETSFASSHSSTHSRLRSVVGTDAPATSPLDIGLPKERLLLKCQETADLLQVSLTTVHNMIDAGVLEAGHIGLTPRGKRNHLRITRESVERFRQQRFGR